MSDARVDAEEGQSRVIRRPLVSRTSARSRLSPIDLQDSEQFHGSKALSALLSRRRERFRALSKLELRTVHNVSLPQSTKISRRTPPTSSSPSPSHNTTVPLDPVLTSAGAANADYWFGFRDFALVNSTLLPQRYICRQSCISNPGLGRASNNRAGRGTFTTNPAHGICHSRTRKSGEKAHKGVRSTAQRRTIRLLLVKAIS